MEVGLTVRPSSTTVAHQRGSRADQSRFAGPCGSCCVTSLEQGRINRVVPGPPKKVATDPTIYINIKNGNHSVRARVNGN